MAVMHTAPQYDLYIRRADQAMRLIERGTHHAVAVCGLMLIGRDVLVRPAGSAVAVCLMRDEIYVVEALPEEAS